MAVMRDRPYGNSNFLVDLGSGDSRSVAAGFCEVIFPRFDIDADRPTPRASSPATPDAAASAGANRLILKRAVIGGLDLFKWWDETRGRTQQPRTIKIELLSDDLRNVVLTWRFDNVRPVSLSYSPLRATEGGIVIETVELAFDGVEMS